MFINPLPSVEKSYGMIAQVEDQLHLNEGNGYLDHKMAMQVGKQGSFQYKTRQHYEQNKFQKRLTKEERRRLRCTHCQENGHEVHKCFKLHGYPDWYKRLKENKGNARVSYLDEDDTRSRLDSGRQYQGGDSPYISNIVLSEIAKCLGQLMQKLQTTTPSPVINMIHSKKQVVTPFDGHYAFSIVPSMTKAVWILDSGASTHLCYEIEMMTSTYRFEKPLSVHLPEARWLNQASVLWGSSEDN